MVRARLRCDNRAMSSNDPGSVAPTTVSAARAGPTTERPPRPRLHRCIVVIGWVAAWSMALLGLLIGWAAFHLANCKLGFFGDYGPLPDATGINSADLIGQSIAWAVATLPWWGVMIWPRKPEGRRQSAAVIGLLTLAISTLFLASQIGRNTSEWASICGGYG